jgi:8-oxo-dGTP diphosphatase
VSDASAPAVAVDVALFTVRDATLEVLLVRAHHGPFAGWWALPGGRVGERESLDEAARRHLRAQTGVGGAYLEQLYTFGSPTRDPRDRVVSVAYLGLLPAGPAARVTLGSGQDTDQSADLAWTSATRLPPLAYDHRTVLRTALARLRAKVQYTNLVYTLLPRAFTLGELQAVYEAILGRGLDRRNFRKKVLSLPLLQRLPGARRGAHRPAALYGFQRRRPLVTEVL